MKKYLVYLSIIMVTLASCKGNQNKQESDNPYEVKPEMEVTSRDTLGVLSICNAYFDKLVAKDLGGAVSMIKVLSKDSTNVEELPDSVKQQQLIRASMFPVYGYEVEKIQFFKETDSKAEYFIYITPKTEGEEQAKMSITFRPVKIGNDWFLTLADTFSETKESVFDE